MKGVFKKISATMLAISLVISFAGEAFAYSDVELAEAILASAIETIAADYNGEIDYDRLVKSALYGIFSGLDEHSAYLPEEDFEEFISGIKPSRLLYGILFHKGNDGKIRIRQIYEGSSAIDAGLMAGDVLVSANGISVEGMSVSKAIAEMNKNTSNKADAVFMRDELEIKAALEKRELANKTVFVYGIEDMLEQRQKEKAADVRIVQIGAVGENTADEMKMTIEDLKNQGVKRIILDLRGNEGGYFDVGIDICKMLVSRGAVLSKVEGGDRILTYYSAQEKAPFDEIVVLTDGNTASAAEMITACLKDRGSKIIGQQTYGKASIQSVYETYGGAFKLTTGEYFSPSGTKINKVGIVPDIYVEFPDFLGYTLETTGEDILQLKKILSYCGYEIGSLDETYDELTKASVVKAKTAMGMEATDKVDIYVKDAINNMYFETFENEDKVLDAACKYLFTE